MTDDIVGNTTAEDGTTDSTSMRIFAVNGASYSRKFFNDAPRLGFSMAGR